MRMIRGHVKAVGQQLSILPVGHAAGMAATPLGAESGFYAMAVVLLALRLWQKQTVRKGAYCSFIAAVFFLTSMLSRLIF